MAAPDGTSSFSPPKLFVFLLVYNCTALIIRERVCTNFDSLPYPFFNCGLELQPPIDDWKLLLQYSMSTTELSFNFNATCTIVWLRQRPWIAKRQLLVMKRNSTHKMILLLISGIEPNPGPRGPRFPCTVCSKACKKMTVACDHCDKWTHKNCVNMSTASFERLGDSDEQWFCPNCRSINNSKLYTIPDDKADTTQPISPTPPAPVGCTSFGQLSSIPSDISSSELSTTVDEEVANQTDNSTAPQESGIGKTSSPKTPQRENFKQHKNKRQLRVLTINFYGARKKGSDLEALIDASDPDIIIGTETWLNDSVSTAEFFPSYMGFDVHRRDRPTKDSRGGLLLAAKKDLELSEVKSSKRIELLSGTIKIRDQRKMTVAAYYRPPKRVDEEYLATSKEEITRLKKESKRSVFIIGGDFNLPDINWTTLGIQGHNYPERVNQTFLDIIVDNNLEQQVDFTTHRGGNVLDLIMTSHPTFKTRCKPLPPLGNSDHDVILYDTALAPHRPRPPRRKIYLWKNADVEGIKEDVHEFAQSFKPDTTIPDAAEHAWTEIKDKLIQTIEARVPTKTASARHSNPWINTDIRRAIRRKQRAHKKAKKTGKKRDLDRYKKLQAQTRYEIRQASKKYIEEVVCSDYRSNSKKFWAYVKSMRQDIVGVSPLKNKDGYLKSDSLGKAEILNDQFKSVFTEEDTTTIPTKGPSPYPEMPPITVSVPGVRKLLQNLRPDKATGPDAVPAFILKTAAEEIAPALTAMFQLSLDTNQVPEDWQQAYIVPIFKKGDRQLPENYRPVSLTSITCKVLEHIIHSSVMTHFDQHQILSDAQHGFRKQRSCETQLISTIHDIASNLAEGSQMDVVLLDFSKAFDKVPHQRLLSKLHYYGVRNDTLGWIQAFLTGRSQQVALEGAHSSPAAVKSGVPQGTVLGPLLFLAYINDLPDVVKSSHTRLFADDSLLYRKICNRQDQALLQADLAHLEDWENTWQMSFNASKCNTIRVSPSRRKPVLQTDYTLHGQTLDTVSSSKYLGVTMADDLSWTRHVETVAAKGNRTVGFLRRNFRDCTQEIKAATYTTMVRPTLEYSSTVWDPHLQQDIQLLEKVQRRAARYACNNFHDRTPGAVTRLIEHLKWDSLEERRRHNRLAMLYRIHNGLVDLNPSTFYRPSDRRTRGAQKMYQERINHTVLYHSFIPRTIREWNQLPTTTTSAPSLEAFRRRLSCSSHNLQPPPASP